MVAILLFGLGALGCTAAAVQFSGNTHCRPRLAIASVIALFVVLSLFWQYQVIGPAPFVVPSGDGGNVSSIVAAGLHPERFSQDLVFSDRSNFAFYLTVARPWVALNSLFSHDVGQAYMLLQFPVLLIQLIGFFWLGRRLFGAVFWPTVLAIISLPPVFIFNGELWGNLPAPLTRSVFGAVLPYLVLSALPPFSWRKPYFAMLLCGLSVYVHPVSAPSIALALWIAMLAISPWRERPLKTTFVMGGAGLLFLAISLPFIVVFLPTMIHVASPLVADLQEEGRALIGAQYYSATLALWIALVGGGNNPSVSWGAFYIAWGAALLFTIGAIRPVSFNQKRLFLLVFFVATLLSSFGVAWSDQVIAAWAGRAPVQIDVIRNLRFVLPILMIALIWLLADIQKCAGGRGPLQKAFYALGVLLAGIWLYSFPNPVGRVLARADNEIAKQQDAADFREILKQLRSAPENSVVLPLPAETFETRALAIRYGALQPVLYLRKDMNFLLYSASRNLQTWSSLRADITGLEQREPSEIGNTLGSFIRGYKLRYLLVNQSESTSNLDEGISTLVDEVVTRGRWRLYRLKDLER